MKPPLGGHVCSDLGFGGDGDWGAVPVPVRTCVSRPIPSARRPRDLSEATLHRGSSATHGAVFPSGSVRAASADLWTRDLPASLIRGALKDLVTAWNRDPRAAAQIPLHNASVVKARLAQDTDHWG
jgi:hypothetical protein